MTSPVLTHLREDHGRFERLFAEVERQCAALEGGATADVARLRAIAWYFVEYGCRRHNAAENTIFFVLVGRLPTYGRDIYDLVADHRMSSAQAERFAEAVATLKEATQETNGAFVVFARGYVGNERGHFISEEELFFPYAERHIERTQWDEIEKQHGEQWAFVPTSPEHEHHIHALL